MKKYSTNSGIASKVGIRMTSCGNYFRCNCGNEFEIPDNFTGIHRCPHCKKWWKIDITVTEYDKDEL
jgi:Zn finger protein HypA/HybF involved in hydrogenase expression